MCVLIFFFKQKTAYELRISDWSSDVCSSDLPRRYALARCHRDRAGVRCWRAVVLGCRAWSSGRYRRDHAGVDAGLEPNGRGRRSEEDTSEIHPLMSRSYVGMCLRKKNHTRVDTLDDGVHNKETRLIHRK